MAKLTAEQAEVELTEWKQGIDHLNAKRDDIVRKAHRAGVNINRIHTVTGIARSTVYRIVEVPAPPARKSAAAAKKAAPKRAAAPEKLARKRTAAGGR